MNGKKKKLSIRLLAIPLICTLLVCICISGSFHLLMKQYLNDIAKDSMDEKFQTHYAQASTETYYNVEDRVFFLVHAIITEPDKDPSKPIGEWYTNNEKQLSKKILQEMEEKNYYEERVRHTITLNHQTYLVEKRYYTGIFDDYTIQESHSPEAKGYDVYVYINITSAHKIIDMMDRLIVLLSAVFGLLGIAMNYIQLRQISSSFNLLKAYLLRVGKREKHIQPPEVQYEEFERVIDTVEAMSAQIEQSEIQQKQFFQNASHELRTPLMSIQGYTEGLMHHVIDEDTALEVIYRQSQKMSCLVDDILFLSKFEGMVIKQECIDLREIIYRSANNQYMRHIHSEKNIALDIQVPNRMEMIGDEDVLERVFDNILSNAYRYAENHIGIVGGVDEKGLYVDIIDDGCGIAPEDIEHIFERFYKGKNGNFGIGLSMVAEGVEKHKGTVCVRSEPGKTSFSIFLPNKR